MATTYEPLARKQRREADPLSRVLTRAYTIRWETVAYIVLFVLAVFTRFYMLGERVMSHDESLHTRYSFNLYNEGLFQHTPLMHGPILFHMTALMYFLFGDNDFTARIYTSVLGVLMVMFPVLFRRWIGRTGALLASIIFLISPFIMYYNRYIREDTPSIFATLVMVYCMMMYVNGPLHLRRRARWLYLFSGAMLWSLGSKESGFIYVAIFGSFLTLYWFVRLAQHFRKVPGKTVFYFVTIGSLLGMIAAIGFYVILTIIPPQNLPLGPATGSVLEQTSSGISGFIQLLASGHFEAVSLVNWSVLLVAILFLILVGTGVWAYRNSIVRLRARDVTLLILIAIIVCGLLIVVEQRSYIQVGSAEETAEVADPNAEGELASGNVNNLPIVAAWAVGAIVVAAVAVSYRAGWWKTLYRFAELDILIVMGTLILPWLTAIILVLTGAKPTDYSTAGITRAVLALAPLAAISIAVGLAWNWKRWLICAAIFHVLFVFFFTTMFTNVNGLATGMIGSLGYWLEQQGVRRGNQPQYYYVLITMPFYEFLPMIGGILAMLVGLVRFWTFRRRQQEADALQSSVLIGMSETTTDSDSGTDSEAFSSDIEQRIALARAEVREVDTRLRRVPFLLFVSWWALLNIIGYTLAGEKMPWLSMHLTTPLIILAAWYFGRVFDEVDWSRFASRGWLYLLLLPLLFVVLFQVAEPFLVGQSPFAGLQQQQLAQLYEWIALIAVAVLVAWFIYEVARRTGGQHLRSMIGVTAFLGLALLTFRSAWMASFINYDRATEFLVYAHSNTPVKTVLRELEELSQRVTGGPDLRFAYDNETSWPNSWYYRNFPNAVFVGSNPTPQNLNNAVAVVVGEANRLKVEPILEDRYFHFEYIRMWWPMQDYFNLTAQRVANTFDFNPANTQAAQIRRGLFDIWWSRDYSTYSQAVGGSWTLTNWPVSDRMHFYVRKDIAAQVWNLGAGDATALAAPPQEDEVNLCVANWQPRTANLVIGPRSGDPLMMNHPLDIALSEDRVYVADEFNNRVAIYDLAGQYVGQIGGEADPTTGALILSRPNGVAIGPDGNIYIADTWNYRVEIYHPSGERLRGWGQIGQFGFEAQQSPEDAFWGPRDIAVDADGNIYVSDTGNKRIRVYTPDGQWLRDIGSGGSGPGQLDEPSGLAIHPDGRLFVADAWNRRISVFTLEGQALYQFPVRGWYDDQGNRPYLALDAARNLLYVGDPEAGRVLIYDTNGNCVGSFGQSGEELPEASQLNIVGGLTTDSEGNLYVADARAGRILRFEPFVAAPVAPPPASREGEDQPEATVDVVDEIEVTAPVDADGGGEESAEQESPDNDAGSVTEEIEAVG